MTTFQISIAFLCLFQSSLTAQLPCISNNEVVPYSSAEVGGPRNRSTRSLLHPIALLSTIEIIDYYDYNGETHNVTTEDGYILQLHRITGKKNATSKSGKPVVLLMHGILASSSDWVIAGPKSGLAFILADQGYDVWMGNARGNIYSEKHISLKTNQRQFWDFSWHEIGMYDLPAKINYITKETGVEKVIYIGHSQGTTAFYVMTSERPEYNDKVHIMVSLAPIAYLSKLFSPLLRLIAEFVYSLDALADILGIHGITPTNEIMSWASSIICMKYTVVKEVCRNLLFMICGFDHEQMDDDLLQVIVSHVPAGSSVKQFIHFGQIIRGKSFRKYDYGVYTNWSKYGRSLPPAYNVSNIRVPIALFYSHNDWLSCPEDVDILHRKLSNPIGKFRVYYDQFSHLDFLWAKDIKELLYNDLLDLMKTFEYKWR